MSENWTKGPWWVEVGDGEDDDGFLYIAHEGTESPDTTVCSFEGNGWNDTANAHLVAAAPEMYGAIKTHCNFCDEAECGECVFSEVLKKARGES